MKTNHKGGKQFRLVAGTGVLLVGACLAGSTSAVADEAKAPAPAKPADSVSQPDITELVNWIEFGMGGNFVKGDKAQFQAQSQQKNGVFGGIESFHYETPLGKDKKGLLSLDGRGIFDNHDYDVKLEVSHPDKGYVKVGYTEFLEYYDGSGGYLPTTGLSFPGLFNNDLAVDRRHISFEAGLTLPDKPEVTLRYDLDMRNGTKDSIAWGPTYVPVNSTPASATRKLMTPSYRDLDEAVHSFAIDLKHNIGETEFGLGGRYQTQHDNDQVVRFMYPGRVATTQTSRELVQDSGVNSSMFNVHGFTDTKLSEKWEFTTGYSYSQLNSTLFGSRLDAPIIVPQVGTDNRFTNLQGGSDVNQYVLNLNLLCSPNKDWSIIPAVRVEREDSSGQSTAGLVTGVAPAETITGNLSGNSEEGALYVSESLDVRYVGITNWAFYGRVELSEDQSQLGEHLFQNTPAKNQYNDTFWTHLLQKYTVGLNWYPLRTLNFGAQYYHKISDNHYTSPVNWDPTSYPGFIGQQNFNVDDVNFRMTWRPCPQLSLISRYDFQLSRVATQTQQEPSIQSAANEQHMFGQTITWSPVNWMYVQAMGNYVVNTTQSPAEDVGAVAGVVLSSPNGYWTAGGTIGFALDNKTDLQLNYSHYEANDYVNNSVAGVPYGSGAREDQASATLTRQISTNLRWSLKYAFSKYDDQTSGGLYNFQAQGIQTSVQYRF